MTLIFISDVLITFESPWYDLRGWLGVKNQLYIIYLSIGKREKRAHFNSLSTPFEFVITMKNFNRRNFHGHDHGSKWRELAQHAHSHGSHAFTDTLTSTQLQPRGAKRQLSYYFSAHAGSFRVSVIHLSLAWTTGSLTCVRGHSCACVYIRRLGTPTVRQHNMFDSKSAHFFLGLAKPRQLHTRQLPIPKVVINVSLVMSRVTFFLQLI